jgi:hypothetical protein
MPAVDFNRHHDGMVVRCNGTESEVEQFLLDRVDLRGVKAGRRQHGTPVSSAMPIRMYPPPKLWMSLANAQSVCNTASGFQPSLNSRRSHSTGLPLRRSLMLMGSDMLYFRRFRLSSAFVAPDPSITASMATLPPSRLAFSTSVIKE